MKDSAVKIEIGNKPKVMKAAEKIEIGSNKDILTLIFLRLPTKELLKFKCVSRIWLCIISNPQFCLSHTRHHQCDGFLEPSALLLKVNYITSPAFDVVPLKPDNIEVPFFDHYVNAPNVNLLQSCNGLLLCESVDGDKVSRYFICNPTTKKFKMLSFPRNPVKDCQFSVNLAFDPLKSPERYKIICIREVSKLSYKFEMDIYWSKTDSWTVSVISFEVDTLELEEVIFCNGMIHWNSYVKKSRYFDVENERLQEMPMPTTTDVEHEIYRYLGEARGTLYLASTHFPPITLEVDVYEMASDYSNWFLKRRLNLGDAVQAVIPDQLNLGYPNSYTGFSGVSFIRSEKEQEPRVVVWADGRIIVYNFNDGNWTKLYEPGPGVKIGSRNVDIFARLPTQRFFAYKHFENLSCI